MSTVGVGRKRSSSIDSDLQAAEEKALDEFSKVINAWQVAGTDPWMEQLPLLVCAFARHFSFFAPQLKPYRNEEYFNELFDTGKISGRESKLWRNKFCQANNDRDLVQLLALFPGEGRPPSPKSGHIPESVQMESAVRAWDVPYVGKAHILLLLMIRAANVDPKYWSNVVAILSSSGTGKSRAADQLAILVFTIPFNLRAEKSGYPDPDSSIKSALDVAANGDDYSKMRLGCLIFLTIVFEEVKTELVSNNCTCNSPEDWRKYLEHKISAESKGTLRNDLYRRILNATYKRIPVELPETLTPAEYTATFDLYLKDHALPALAALRAVFCQWHNPEPDLNAKWPLVLYFDECQSIMAPLGRVSAYDALCSAIAAFSADAETPLYSIFLSTNSNVAQLAPARQVHPSSRVLNHPDEVMLVPPFVELPFDVYKDGGPIIKEEDMTLDEVCETPFLVRFGRPLWWTRYESATRAVKNDIFNFAMMKLASSADLNRDSESNTDLFRSALTAALSMRCLLDFDPTREAAQQIEIQQVKTHMRIAFSVPHHRQYMRTGTPSEPVLAEAAARILWRFKAQALTQLAHLYSSGAILKGERGELVSRYILNQAHDSYVKSLPPRDRRDGGDAEFARPVPLLEFLKHLFPDNWHDILLNSLPQNLDSRRQGANAEMPTLAESFENAWVHFTHWAKAGDESVFSTEALWKALSRGMAWICADNQAIIDLIIPIFFGDPKNIKLGRGVVSFLFVQCKDKKNMQSVSFALDPKKILDAKSKQWPYIFLVMQLGVQPAQKSRSQGPPATPSKVKVSRSAQPQSAETRSKKDEAPRYEIHVLGCSANVYKVIKPHEKDVYQGLLAARSVLPEHPRQEEEFISAVKRLKPFFMEGPDSYGWAENSSDVTGDKEDEPLGERVTVIG